MRRLCFLVPDIAVAHSVVDDLRANAVADASLYVVAHEGTPLGDLPDAGVSQKSDFYQQLERGLATGGVIGVIGGLIAMRIAGAVIGGAAVLIFGALGAGINALLAAIAGAAFPNSRLAQFESAIEAGRVLIMVDTPTDRVADIQRIIRSRHVPRAGHAAVVAR